MSDNTATTSDIAGDIPASVRAKYVMKELSIALPFYPNASYHCEEGFPRRADVIATTMLDNIPLDDLNARIIRSHMNYVNDPLCLESFTFPSAF